MSRAPEFDPCDGLERLLAVQASAGTGKTYALAGLATRLLAEGVVRAPDLLVVTFTRAATAELRSRVRERVAGASAHLGSVLAGGPPDADDELYAWLASSGPRGTLQGRYDLLEVALSEFDAATITTIHGFAAQVLAALGVGAGVPGDLTFTEAGDERIVEACTDVLAQAALEKGADAEPPSWDRFYARVKQALGAAEIVVRPDDDPHGEAGGDPDSRRFAALVRAAVSTVRGRRRQSGTQTFDDLLVGLRSALGPDGATGPAAISLRTRFGAALIDEFQDTDPVQWEIFRTLFASRGSAASGPNGVADDTMLVLVGDPKQAIYSFRGADVHTYTEALRTTPGLARRTLGTNWRSDGPVIEVTDTLFNGVGFGPDIEFESVSTAPGHDQPGLRRAGAEAGAGEVPALSLRCNTATEGLKKDGSLYADPAREHAFADLVEHAVDLLESCEIRVDGAEVDGGARYRPLRPRDIAVLVRNNSDASHVQGELVAAGVPAVLARGESVLASAAATQLTWLLEAMVRPSDQRRARTFAASWFGGWTPEEVAAATDDQLVGMQQRLHDWNSLLVSRGTTVALHRIWNDTGVVPAVLSAPDGDRSVTDLEHLAELLRTAVGDQPASAGGLLGALDGMRKGVAIQSDTDRDTDVTSRRVESDAEAVQIMTVWVAKGLEFPVVMCPTLWTGPRATSEYHDDGVRTMDVRPPSDLRKVDPEAAEAAAREHADEDMRLLYVALTRARHHTALWWANSSAGGAALTRLLFARDAHSAIDPELCGLVDLKPRLPTQEDLLDRLAPLARLCGPAMALSGHGAPGEVRRRWNDAGTPTHGSEPVAAVFSRPDGTPLDRSRSRWSFSAMVSRDGTHGDPWDLSIDDEGADDEQRPPDLGLPGDAEEVPVPAAEPEETGGGGALAWLPAGAAFGTLAHDVLERVDFTAEDLGEEVLAVVQEQCRWRSLGLRRVGDPRPGGDPAAERDGEQLLATGLADAICTPLGGPFSDPGGAPTRLRDLSGADRLDELAFEMPLVGADPSAAASTERDIGSVLAATLPTGDPFLPWAERLARGAFGVTLAGHMTGSIDLVARVRSGDRPQFVVVDYKTNRLHDHGTDPSPGAYGAAAMQRSMVEHHYPLQALIYMVALHRYLRWRLPGYDPGANLGGACYLFLRGMKGANTPIVEGVTEGVCGWRPPAAAVTAVSDLLGFGPDAGGGP